ncbi:MULTISPECIES: ABC transporter ATP-binding protein [unclassified Chelatococcus]|uniref:ABC transporter ATP-binding protein n=1 Tax=unclassified Chelatococcus TaxID=2638111 RepID=UPI001BD12E1F|nr:MULTISPECIES: ABC transporter ATP-binding protein [unclassified Chelatococcus]MBS7700502.1 ABC transporter ATP-binding protein [Chelatococcus sp. YT9]MBX3556298.1 ABC transporter ATP-binding protein [Chelatococcus sp.]
MSSIDHPTHGFTAREPMAARERVRTDAAKLTVTDLNFSIAQRKLLDGIMLSLAPGERFGIIGPNGSGKSTLLRCLYAWHRPDSGQVCLNGQDLFTLDATKRACEVAVLAQHAEASLGLTIEEVVALGRLPHRRLPKHERADDDDAIERALTAVDMLAWRQRSFAPLSGGEKQRVLFARALAQQPSILILDEPTNHLDIRHQLMVLEVARSQNITVIATLHDLNIAARWCDRLCLLDQGRIRRIGPPETVLDPVLIGAVYGVDVERDRDPRTGHPRLSFHLPLQTSGSVL